MFVCMLFLGMFLGCQQVAFASAGSAVEVWDHYNVTIKVDPATTRVTEELTIKNVIDKPVVPGYGYISLSREQGSSVFGLPLPVEGNLKGLEIRDVSARLDDGTLITDILVNEEEEATTVRYGFWTPVMPGECRSIIIEYSSDEIVEKGLFFDHITYAVQPSSIPIKNALIKADLGEKKHILYSSTPPFSGENPVTWKQSGLEGGTWQLDFEYSSLPLPHSPVKWSNLGMGLVFGIVCFWSYRQWMAK